MLNMKFRVSKVKPMSLPVSTLSPICSSGIVTDLPFSRITLAVDGKQPPPPDGAEVVVGGPSKQVLT